MAGNRHSRFPGLFRLAALLVSVCLLAACGPIEAPEPVSTIPPTTEATTAPPETTVPTEIASPYTIDETCTQPPAETLPPLEDPYDPMSLVWRDLQAYAWQQKLNPNLYTQLLAELYFRNPDAREFCLEYPRLWNKESTADMSAYENAEGVPLFLQWDPQWGYFDYGGNLMGLSGCGPTTLAMAAYYFTGDPDMNPLALAQFAMDNGYRYLGNGTAWSFMYDGARRLGLRSQALSLDEQAMIRALDDGALIICIMGPGQFTTGGHFILLTGYRDGAFTVNDCNSITRSRRTWTYEELCGEIRNLWAIRG